MSDLSNLYSSFPIVLSIDKAINYISNDLVIFPTLERTVGRQRRAKLSRIADADEMMHYQVDAIRDETKGSAWHTLPTR